MYLVLHIGIGGWSAPLQQVRDCHIADLPARGKLVLSNHQWKLFREAFIILWVTTISDIITACSGYFTPAASKVRPSHPSVFQLPRQQYNITNKHKSVFHQILAVNTNNHHHKLIQPLGAWITTSTTIRKYVNPARWYTAGMHFFDSAHERIKMMQTKTKAIDYPYPTTNTASLYTLE